LAPSAGAALSLRRKSLADGQQGIASWADRTDLGRVGKAVLPEDIQNSGDAVRAAGNQEAAAGLRVGEERLGFGREVRRQGDVVTVRREVAARGTGDDALFRQRFDSVDQRYARPFEVQAAVRAARQFERVAGESETGDVGHGVHAGQGGKFGAGGVQLGRDGDHFRVTFGVDRVLLEGRRQDADTERLAEDDAVAGAGIGIALDQLWVNQPEGD